MQAIRDGDECAMRDLARLAIAAFGRRGEGSGVLGVDVQRIRRALDLRTDAQPREDGARAAHARPDPPLRAAAAARARARADRAHAGAAARAAAQRARPRAAVRPAAGPRRRAPRRRCSSSAGWPPRATRRAGRRAHAHVDVRRTMRASLQTGGVPVELKFRPQRPRRPELYVLCDVSTERHQRVRLLPLRAARAARLVPQDALVRVRRADLRGHRRLRARAQLQGGLGGDRPRRRRRRRVRLHGLRARLARVPRRSSRTTCTRARR